MASEVRAARRSGLFLKSPATQLVKLRAQTMSQRAFRPQLPEQSFRLHGNLFAEFVLAEQFQPASGNLLFGEQS